MSHQLTPDLRTRIEMLAESYEGLDDLLTLNEQDYDFAVDDFAAGVADDLANLDDQPDLYVAIHRYADRFLHQAVANLAAELVADRGDAHAEEMAHGDDRGLSR